MLSVALLIVGLAAGAADLRAILEQERIEQDVPGVSAVVSHEGSVLFAGGAGVADVETGQAMSADTILYAGSLTKILTAVLALDLVGDGSLSLDEIARNVADGRHGITVTHLLTHTSGLVREGDFGYWFNADFPDNASLTAFLATTELRSTPGEQVRYSNIGFAALGQMLAISTGMPFHDALRERVLQPLGMTSTGSPGPAGGVARGYTPRNRIIPSEDRPFAGIGRPVGDRFLREYHDARAMTPAFGAYTSASDLGRLARFLLGYGTGDLLPETLRKLMLEPQSSGRSFGLGTERFEGRLLARHGGWFAAHKSHILIDPASGVSVVVLANSDGADPDATARALLREALNSELSAD